MAAMILALNAGSSSVKYGLFEPGAQGPEPVASGVIEGDPGGADVMARIVEALGDRRPDAIGHRIVHGGPTLFSPVVIDHGVIEALEAARAFAPLHAPAALALIAAARDRYPDVTQVACFDTGFHEDLPPVAAVLPVPGSLRAEGVRRYGFHGLSCQSILHRIGAPVPNRIVIAHLGSGASVTAVRDGRSVDTSMGLTPSGGVVMATRSGDIDPGLLLYLLRERGMTAATLETLIDRESGLQGISGRSSDMRVLRELAASDPDVALAIAIFCRSVAKQIAAMAVSLGGIDLLVFSGGIGEHDTATRDAICAELGWMGLPHDGAPDGPVAVRVIAPREEEQIARDTARLLAG